MLPLRFPKTATSRQRAELWRRRHPRSRRRPHGCIASPRSDQSPDSKTCRRLQQSYFRTTQADHAHVLRVQLTTFPLSALTLQKSRLRCVLVAGNDHNAQPHKWKPGLRRFLRRRVACQCITSSCTRVGCRVRRLAERWLEHAHRCARRDTIRNVCSAWLSQCTLDQQRRSVGRSCAAAT